MNSNLIWFALFFSLIMALISGLFSYFAARWLAKWFKNVKIINQRKDLDKSPKLTEIVKTVKTVCRHYQLPFPEIGIYPSWEINAFATGRPNNTLIAFSSGLINNFTTEEIKGVVAHELSHLLHNDLGAILLFQGFFDFLFYFLNFLLWIGINNWVYGKKDRKERGVGGQILLFFLTMIIYHILSTILRIITILPVLWFIRKRELKADRKAARIVGFDRMILSLKKLLILENKSWVVDGIDLSEENDIGFDRAEKDRSDNQQEPNSISLLKINPEKKKRDWFLELFRTHPPLEKRIEILEKLKQRSGSF